MSARSDRPGSERRAQRRVATDIPVSVDANGEISCRVVNLSMSGAGAICSHEMPEMAQVRMRIQVTPDEGAPVALWCDGAVVRSQRRPDGRYEVGIFFMGLSESDKDTLDRIIELQTAPHLA